MNDFTLDDVIYLPFTTRAFATGIPTVLAGSPTVEIYEDASATPIVEGAGKLVLALSLNSVVGFNIATVTLSAANGFETGKHYTLIIKTGTVGGVSVVGEVVSEFTIGFSAAAVNLAAGVNVVEWKGTTIVTPTTTGVPNVGVTHWLSNGVAWDVIGPGVSVIGWKSNLVPTPNTNGYPLTDPKLLSGSQTAATNLKESALGIIPGIAQTGTLSTTQMTSNLSGYLDDELIGRVVVWQSGTATGQASTITDYASSSGLVTFDAVTTAPANADTFVIV